MALSDSQKAACRLYLGYPDGFRFRNTRLESVMDNISPEGEQVIVSLLANLATLDTQIITSAAAYVAGVKRVDEITFFDPVNGMNVGFTNGKAAGKWLAGRLSVVLGVPFFGSAFGSGGYPGDSFFGGGGGSGNGILPLG